MLLYVAHCPLYLHCPVADSESEKWFCQGTIMQLGVCRQQELGMDNALVKLSAEKGIFTRKHGEVVIIGVVVFICKHKSNQDGPGTGLLQPAGLPLGTYLLTHSCNGQFDWSSLEAALTAQKVKGQHSTPPAPLFCYPRLLQADLQGTNSHRMIPRRSLGTGHLARTTRPASLRHRQRR